MSQRCAAGLDWSRFCAGAGAQALLHAGAGGWRQLHLSWHGCCLCLVTVPPAAAAAFEAPDNEPQASGGGSNNHPNLVCLGEAWGCRHVIVELQAQLGQPGKKGSGVATGPMGCRGEGSCSGMPTHACCKHGLPAPTCRNSSQLRPPLLSWSYVEIASCTALLEGGCPCASPRMPPPAARLGAGW